MKKFPPDFIFGTGTSAYQIEGAPKEDGKGPSIWDTFCATEGKVFKGHTGEVACDHYNRVDEDIALMQEIGLDSYRFSVSWARVFPKQGELNALGLQFYVDLVAKLKGAGIMPVVTLNHWDVPVWMYEKGSWLNRESVAWFDEFAITMFEALGSEVPYWITHNEPFVIAMLGYYMGLHAPGHKDLKEALITSHHLNLSHGQAVRSFRKIVPTGGKIGITLNISPSAPFDDTSEDRELAHRAEGFVNRWFLEPLFKGTYPQYMVDLYEPMVGPMDFIQPGDASLMTEPMDFFGINFYKRNKVKKKETGLLGYVGIDDPQPATLEEWKKYPDVLLDLLRMVRDEYTDLPLIITENGLGLESAEAGDVDASRFGTYITVEDTVDEKGPDGKVHDDTRIAYVHNCLRQCLDFIEEGGKLEGYYLWSLMDNFEWALGYSKRFGIVHVDFDTLERTIKESGHWYASVITERGLPQ